MNPTQVLLTGLLTRLGSDTAMLAGALFLFPIKTAFAPGPDPGLLDTDLADFDGSTAKTTAAATRPVLVDPVTGSQFLRMPDPAGGWQWTTTGTTNLPQTIYGLALGSSSVTIEGGALLATALLDNPQALQAPAGQSFGYGDVTFTMVLPALQ